MLHHVGQPRQIRDLFAYLCTRDGEGAIDFYKQVFGAAERFQLTKPNGRMTHVEPEFGPVTVMVPHE